MGGCDQRDAHPQMAEPLLVRLTKKHFETAAESLRVLLEDHALTAARHGSSIRSPWGR